MKIRNNYVSNSSSSSFIIIGNNVIEILEKNINNNEKIYSGEFTYGEVNKEILRQCKYESNENKIKDFIYEMIYNLKESYITYIYESEFNQSNHYFHSEYNFIEDFTLTDKMKSIIYETMKNNKKDKEDELYYFCLNYGEEYDKEEKELIDKIYNDLIANNKEVYTVSFGDNHGNCNGSIGEYVEHEYLGEKIINSCLNSNFKIYQVSEH